jgi:hypothetical protein
MSYDATYAARDNSKLNMFGDRGVTAAVAVRTLTTPTLNPTLSNPPLSPTNR